MIWLIALVLIVVIGFAIMYFIEVGKDGKELQAKPLAKKFCGIVQAISEDAFNGYGSITYLSKSEFVLGEEGHNQIAQFHYGAGTLTIVWKYKFLQKELVHKKVIQNARNISIWDEIQIGLSMVEEMKGLRLKHQLGVLKG